MVTMCTIYIKLEPHVLRMGSNTDVETILKIILVLVVVWLVLSILGTVLSIIDAVFGNVVGVFIILLILLWWFDYI